MKAAYNIKIDGRWYHPGEEIPEMPEAAPATGNVKPETLQTEKPAAMTIWEMEKAEKVPEATKTEKPRPATTRRKKSNA